MADSILGRFVNPFVRNPDFDKPESNFIEQGISNGIERAFGNIGNKILHSGQLKLESFAENLPQIASVSLMAYLIYLGYRAFLKRDIPDFTNVYTSIMVYTIFRLFWKVVLHI